MGFFERLQILIAGGVAFGFVWRKWYPWCYRDMKSVLGAVIFSFGMTLITGIIMLALFGLIVYPILHWLWFGVL